MRDRLRNTGAISAGQFKRVPLTHMLTFKYNVDWHELVNAGTLAIVASSPVLASVPLTSALALHPTQCRETRRRSARPRRCWTR
jgi:hypothetical protein